MSLDRVGEVVHAALQELVDRDGSARAADVLLSVQSRVKLTDVEKSLNKSGVPRWETNLRFYTTSCVKAGYLQKGKGYWKITDQGREALKKPASEFIREVNKRYNEWAATQRTNVPDRTDELTTEVEEDASLARREIFEKAEEQARLGIEEFIHDMTPYDFQEIVGHLLRAMGYYVAHNAPPGPDGGVDLIVYKDALGTIIPRVKVQVKHRRDTKVTVKEIRELHGLLHNDEVGLMVSSGGFTSDSAREARSSSKHVDLIDLERFVTLWQEHYHRTGEDARAMLPLVPLYFLLPAAE